jgi:hypothetical protein
MPSDSQRERHDYADGWHLLLRGLNAERVYEDILEWVTSDARDVSVSALGARIPPQASLF